MRTGTFIILLVFAALSTVAKAQSATGVTEAGTARPELELNYAWQRTNGPPGSCGCFALNGGGANFAWPIGQHFSVAGDFLAGINNSANVAGQSYDLTLTVFTAGGRYRPLAGQESRLQPFLEGFAGVAHSSGSLVEKPNPGAANAGAAFAAKLGGGLDLKATRHFALRLFEADYVVTTFDNADNGNQNNLLLGGGVILRF
jgi:hypothetical protein